LQKKLLPKFRGQSGTSVRTVREKQLWSQKRLQGNREIMAVAGRLLRIRRKRPPPKRKGKSRPKKRPIEKHRHRGGVRMGGRRVTIGVAEKVRAGIVRDRRWAKKSKRESVKQRGGGGKVRCKRRSSRFSSGL